MTKMLQSWVGQTVLAAVAIAVAVFAAIALDRADANAQAGSVKSLSLGGDHACALTTTDEIICWGRSDGGQTDAPERHEFISLGLGEDYSCGLNSSGRITAARVPNWLENEIVGISCWGTLPRIGATTYGRAIGITHYFGEHSTNYLYSPEGIGVTHACGRDANGTRCYGSNAFGQHDLGGGGVVVGGWHTCRINSDNGAIQCVGRNDSGQTDVPNGQYLSVDAGREHTCAVTSANRLRCWGEDNLGQSSPPGGSDYLEVSSNAFANFNCALTDERKVRCWGDNRYQQLNVPAAIAAPPPLQFTQPIAPIITRQNQPIGPFIFPPASGGKGRLSYNIAHTKRDSRKKKGPPTGLVFDEPGWITLHYSVSDTSGRSEEYGITLTIIGPVPAGYAPAITWPELGTLDRGLIRCGVWSDESISDISLGAYDEYAFHLAAPAQLTINLESEDADTYLFLAGGEWRDDDGGQGTNSRLTVGLPPARYRLHVFTADGRGEGAYTLRITSPDFLAGNADASRSCPDGSASRGSTSTSTDEGTLDSATAGRIAARRIANGSIEFAWQVEGGDRVLPRSRYLPADARTGRWLNSSAIVVEGVEVGKINVRVDAETGRIEFAFTPTGGERILPPSRYFPSSAETGVWLQSTLIEPDG